MYKRYSYKLYSFTSSKWHTPEVVLTTVNNCKVYYSGSKLTIITKNNFKIVTKEGTYKHIQELYNKAKEL